METVVSQVIHRDECREGEPPSGVRTTTSLPHVSRKDGHSFGRNKKSIRLLSFSCTEDREEHRKLLE